MKAAACAKHFAVHSGPESLRHEFDAKASKKDMAETYLPAFEAAVKEAHVEAVMGAYNRTNGEPCCASSALQKILRGDWGFEGHFVSDCWALRDFHEHHRITLDSDESAAMAIHHGCDLNCGCVYRRLMRTVVEGAVKEEEITQAAVRLFTTRYLLGIMEGSEYDNIPYHVVDCREHRQLAQEAARKSMVLLKNDGILPLRKEGMKTIGVIGPNADSRRALIGNYHGTSSRYITVLEGIEDYLGDDVRVLYSQGCHLYKDRTEALAFANDRVSEALAVAEESDVVVLCLGLDETLEGEEGDTGNSDASGDKIDLSLPEPQRFLLEKLAETGKPLVLVLLAGSAMDLNFAQEHCSAILQAWYPGGRGGKAVAEVLFGKYSPSGKLPVTFYKCLEDLPDFTDYSMKGRTYRYLEKEPLYPFGFGLTYGKAYVETAAITSCAEENKDLTVEAEIVNMGDREVEEVVQVYCKNLDSSLAVPNHSLCAFQRVRVSAGGRQKLGLVVPWSAFLTVGEEGERVFDGNAYRIYVGTSQPDQRSLALGAAEPIELEVSFGGHG